jgi:hypothetical protein
MKADATALLDIEGWKADGPHLFLNGGPCVYCKTTRERVADRRAPPFCVEAPEDDERAEPDSVAGY